MPNKTIKILLGLIIVSFSGCFFYWWGQNVNQKIYNNYQNNRSTIIFDRNNNIIEIKPNAKGYYANYAKNIPARFKSLLLRKEDKYFYFHPGINPVSLARAAFHRLINFKREGSSTITQQLAKILLSHEGSRNLKNKIIEAIYTILLETYYSKDQILLMYVNSIYFGNNTQGLAEACQLYFDKSPEMLDDAQILELLAAINNPSFTPPNTKANIDKAKILAQKFNIANFQFNLSSLSATDALTEKYKKNHRKNTAFELSSLSLNCQSDCHTSIDENLNESVREITKRLLSSLVNKNTTNAAVIILSEPNNELVAMVGSPDPNINAYGYQINMATKPRPIGSTIKPLIYLEGFKKGLRPYTKVLDKEYKYIINDGFSIYPKNYDLTYHGEVDLHYALSNSLNVPTVRVLEYVGQDAFSNFLINDLHFHSTQDINNYGLGTALGGLEMDLLSLTYYFSIFVNDGQLAPLAFGQNIGSKPSSLNADFSWSKSVSDKKYIQLLNKILSDRLTGVEEFGLKSSLNLPANNYAVKTGTSREFHDSWTIGYTPDFIVGVWVGNSDNTPMDKISGQLGAGKIWQETMNLMINSSYNKKRNFNFDLLQEYSGLHGIEYGLKNDNIQKSLNLLNENSLILKPHNNDIFLWEKNNKIICQSEEEVQWIINYKKLEKNKEVFFLPHSPGEYVITADNGKKQESVIILVK